MRLLPQFCSAFVACWMLASVCHAQLPTSNLPPSYRRPTISPYLNLLDRTRSPAFNYYKRVRPERYLNESTISQQREIASQAKSIKGLRNEVDETQQLLQSETSQLGGTGFVARFQDLGGYFPRRR